MNSIAVSKALRTRPSVGFVLSAFSVLLSDEPDSAISRSVSSVSSYFGTILSFVLYVNDSGFDGTVKETIRIRISAATEFFGYTTSSDGSVAEHPLSRGVEEICQSTSSTVTLPPPYRRKKSRATNSPLSGGFGT